MFETQNVTKGTIPDASQHVKIVHGKVDIDNTKLLPRTVTHNEETLNKRARKLLSTAWIQF
jgi:hypothetical protein